MRSKHFTILLLVITLGAGLAAYIFVAQPQIAAAQLPIMDPNPPSSPPASTLPIMDPNPPPYGPSGTQNAQTQQYVTNAANGASQAEDQFRTNNAKLEVPTTDANSNITKCADMQFQPTGGTAAGNYVPVLEVDGPLLNYVKSTNQQTGLTSTYAQDLCKYNRATESFQYQQANKTFVDDPTTVLQRGVQVEKYRTENENMIQTGYKMNAQGDTSKMFPENWNELFKNVQQNALSVFTDALNGSNNMFKDSINKQIQQESASGFSQAINSTMSQSEYDSCVKGGTSSGGSSSNSNFWSCWGKIIQPQNNYAGSYGIARSQYLAQQANDTQNTRDQLMSSQGFLPNQTCAQPTADGKGCAKWITNSPGSIIQGSLAQTLQSRLQELLGADSSGQLLSNSYPLVEDITSLQPLLNRQQSDNNNNNNTDTPPTIDFSFTAAALADIATGSPNTATLTWSAPTASRCEASNDWLGSGGVDAIATIKPSGTSLGKRGSLAISFPLSFGVSVTRDRTTTDGSGNPVTTSITIPITNTPSADLLSQSSTITFPDGNQPGDVYTLTVNPSTDPQSVTATVASDTSGTAAAASLNTAINSLQANTAAGQEFLKYNLSTNGAQLVMSLSAPTYSMKCLNSGGVSNASVTITRQ